jgi:hypothetical protein
MEAKMHDKQGYSANKNTENGLLQMRIFPPRVWETLQVY